MKKQQGLRYFRLLLMMLILLNAIYCTMTWAVDTYPFQNPRLPLETRVNDLMARLTADEKITFFHVSMSNSEKVKGEMKLKFEWSQLKKPEEKIA